MSTNTQLPFLTLPITDTKVPILKTNMPMTEIVLQTKIILFYYIKSIGKTKLKL